MTTIKLTTKGDTVQPMAKTDDAWQQLADDDSIDDIPKGSKFGAAPAQSRATYSAQQNQGELLKSTGGAMQEGSTNLVAHSKDSTEWINKKMRPMMGWVYMVTCFSDFVLFPILWSLLQALSDGQVTSQWMPLTLQGAGLYHIAMGAVLGITAYGRTQEKISGAAK